MMSGLLLDFIRSEYHVDNHVSDNVASDDEDANDDVEHTFLKIQTDDSGKLVNHNQLTDYWYRGPSLSHINFYDFVRTLCISTD